MTEIRADIAVNGPIALLRGKIELTADDVVVGRDGRVLARAPYAAVLARKTWLSLGSGVRLRLAGQNVTVDLSDAEWRPRWVLLEILPPMLFVLRVRAGRRAAAAVLAALAERGADAR